MPWAPRTTVQIHPWAHCIKYVLTGVRTYNSQQMYTTDRGLLLPRDMVDSVQLFIIS